MLFGSEELKSTYLPKLYSGEWSGVMDLTESHAGSDLSTIRTKAIDNGDGTYSITGNKIFRPLDWPTQHLIKIAIINITLPIDTQHIQTHYRIKICGGKTAF